MYRLLEGNRPDPSILWNGEAYYMVYSTLRYKPGLIVFRSEDLHQWEPVCSALPDSTICDVWAPDFVRYGDRYYIYFAADGKNWVVWSDRADGGYSAPIDLQADGFIDPGHIVDDTTGQRYIFFNNGYAAPLSEDGLSLTAPPERVAPEWPIPEEWEIEGTYMESPKLCHHGDYYYLTVAQGGTAGPPTSHMAISMRTRQLPGGWEMDPDNPVIHCYSADEPWWSTGHATIFPCEDGRWRAVYHGYPNGDRGRGRLPLLAEVEWTPDGWYRVCTEETEPFLPETFEENFTSEALSLHWGVFDSGHCGQLVRPGEWRLPAAGTTPGDARVLTIQPVSAEYTVTAEFGDADCGYGVTLYYDTRAHVELLVQEGILWQIMGDMRLHVGEWTAAHTWMKLRLRDHVVSVYISNDGVNYKKCPTSISVDSYTQTALGGFLSLRPGVIAVGEGAVSLHRFVCKP